MQTVNASTGRGPAVDLTLDQTTFRISRAYCSDRTAEAALCRYIKMALEAKGKLDSRGGSQ